MSIDKVSDNDSVDKAVNNGSKVVEEVTVEDVDIDKDTNDTDSDCDEDTSPPAPPPLDDSSNSDKGEEIDDSEYESTPEFKKIIIDFSKDILKTYPELVDNLQDDMITLLNNSDDKDNIERLFSYCRTVYPERFFDILYQNEDIFTDDSVDTKFLPDIEFKDLWKENISTNTREQIWKYLQLILFTIVTSLSDEESFGDTAKLFEAINQDEFKSKLEDTIKSMQDIFDGSENPEGKESFHDQFKNMPTPEDIHNHVSGMMEGKLGKLAKEIAEETAKDLNLDMNNTQSVDGVFKSLFKQPTKLMSLVKNVGGKLDEKMKSGDIKESELLEEASDIMKKMKNMPGMGNLKEMFSKMGMNIPNGKMDLNAMRNNINRSMRGAKQKERMQEKLQRRQMEREGKELQDTLRAKQEAATKLQSLGSKNGVEKMVFTSGDKPEKSSIKQKPSTNNKKKKKKKK